MPINWAAVAYPTRIVRCSIDGDPNWLVTTNSAARISVSTSGIAADRVAAEGPAGWRAERSRPRSPRRRRAQGGVVQAGVVQAGLDPVGSRGRSQAHGGRQPDPVHRTGRLIIYAMSDTCEDYPALQTDLKIYPALRILRSILHPRHHLDCWPNGGCKGCYFSGKSRPVTLHMAQHHIPGIRGNPCEQAEIEAGGERNGDSAKEMSSAPEDMTGKGHRTRSIGRKVWRQIFVTLP